MDNFINNILVDFLIRFSLNLAVVLILVKFIYFKRHQNKDFYFTFLLFNQAIFLLCFLLSNVTLQIGFAFGLFAIFSILRYRTVAVPIREMGYFFICVMLGIVNAMAILQHPYKVSFLFLGLINLIVVLLVFFLDKQVALQHENFQEIIYEKLEFITPEMNAQLLADLNDRVGLDFHRVEICKIDFVKKMAKIKAFYYSNNFKTNANFEQDAD